MTFRILGAAFIGITCAILMHSFGIGWTKKPEKAIALATETTRGETATNKQKTTLRFDELLLLPGEELEAAIAAQSLQWQAQFAPLLLREIARIDPSQAVSLLSSFPDSAQPFLAESLVESWREVAPHDALEWAIKNGDTSLIEKQFDSLLGSALDDDPERALKWILEHPETILQNTRWIKNAGMEAKGTTREAVEQFLDKRSDAFALKIASRLIADTDPEFAMELAASIRSRAGRHEAEADVLKRLASSSYESASQVIASKNLPIELRRQATILATHTFLSEGTDATLEWGLTVKHPMLRSQVIEETLWAWTKKDPLAAIDAADALTISGDRDAAFGSVADQLFEKPETITSELAVSLQKRFSELPEDTRTKLRKSHSEIGILLDGRLW